MKTLLTFTSIVLLLISSCDQSKIAKCGTCHPKKAEGPDDKRVTYKRAMHKQCKDCHKESKKGPYKKCSECHIKVEGDAATE